MVRKNIFKFSVIFLSCFTALFCSNLKIKAVGDAHEFVSESEISCGEGNLEGQDEEAFFKKSRSLDMKEFYRHNLEETRLLVEKNIYCPTPGQKHRAIFLNPMYPDSPNMNPCTWNQVCQIYSIYVPIDIIQDRVDTFFSEIQGISKFYSIKDHRYIWDFLKNLVFDFYDVDGHERFLKSVLLLNSRIPSCPQKFKTPADLDLSPYLRQTETVIAYLGKASNNNTYVIVNSEIGPSVKKIDL